MPCRPPLPNLVFGVIPAQFQGLLQALKTEGLAKLIAEPKLVTQSGRPASFLSGGQQATLSAASGINGPGVVYQDIGTEIDFLPIVYGNGKIYLEVAPRVRGVNQGLGITTSSAAPTPGFDDQQVRTSVVLESGQTFAIGGLIQTNVQASTNRVPVLGEIPFLAPFFSTQTDQLTEQELVILVTPHLVDPMDCNQLPRRLPGRETRIRPTISSFTWKASWNCRAASAMSSKTSTTREPGRTTRPPAVSLCHLQPEQRLGQP